MLSLDMLVALWPVIAMGILKLYDYLAPFCRAGAGGVAKR